MLNMSAEYHDPTIFHTSLHSSQDEDDDEEDPDARADPMYGLNLKQYLTEFLHDFCKQAWMLEFAVKFMPAIIKLRPNLPLNIA